MSQPFIGSEALASGVVNRHALDRDYRRLLPNIYIDNRAVLSLRQRAAAAWLWSGRSAVIAGAAAAEFHGTKWVPDDIAIELIGTKARTPSGVITRQELIYNDEITYLGKLPVTSPDRTAFDVGRRGPVGAAVALLDALGRATGFTAVDVLELARRHPRARGLRQLEQALDLFDAGAQSPKETWLRLMLLGAGFPKPRTQIPVPGPQGYPKYFLDMGWEELMLAVEYDGAQHADQLGYDILRGEYVSRMGWTNVRVAAGQRRPQILARVGREWDRLWRPESGIAARTAARAGRPLELTH